MSPLAGKTAVITGASRGIGEAIARSFSAAGANVALLARSNQALVAIATELGDTALALAVDVTNREAVFEAAEQIRERFGGTDIVVNNAGTVVRSSFVDTTYAQFRHVFAVNVDAIFHVTQAFSEDLISRRGRIINISSIAGRQGTPMLSAYCASKHAVVGLTRALAEELRDVGVAVNAICPGSVDTAMLREGLPGATPNMTPQDIAASALFLASSAPIAMTGSCVDVFG